MKFDEMLAAKEQAQKRYTDALRQLNADPPIAPCLQYTLDSGTRCTITGLLDDRLHITCCGGNPWAEQADVGFLTLGMLSVEDLREFLEIRLVIEAWRAGRLADLPMPAKEFDRWVCPDGFEVPVRALGEFPDV